MFRVGDIEKLIYYFILVDILFVNINFIFVILKIR